MNNLNFDEGYKEFTINNDKNRVIRINLTDYGMLTRLVQARDTINKAIKEAGDIDIDAEGKAVDFEKAGQKVKIVDDAIREQIDYLFASKVSDVVFGQQSPMSNIGGLPLVNRFIDALEPFLKEALSQKRAESKKRVSKYTKGIN